MPKNLLSVSVNLSKMSKNILSMRIIKDNLAQNISTESPEAYQSIHLSKRFTLCQPVPSLFDQNII